MDIAAYATATEDQLKAELCTQVDFLAAHYTLLGGTIADRERNYWPAFNGSQGASVSARDKDATYLVLADSLKVIDLRSEINAYVAKIDLLRLLLGSDLRTPARGTYPPDASMGT